MRFNLYVIVLLLSLLTACEKGNRSLVENNIFVDIKALELEITARNKEKVLPYLVDVGTDGRLLYAKLEENCSNKKTVSLFKEGFAVVFAAEQLSHKDEKNASKLRVLAINLADFLINKYVLPNGTILEYDRTTWMTSEEMWRVVPWGTGFRGNEMLRAYRLFSKELSPSQLSRWNKSLDKMAEWLYHNTYLGAYNFNCTIDLCHLLWALGKERNNEEWCRWALNTSYTLIKRYVDDEGWITGEDNGISGLYQLVGQSFLTSFARNSGDSILKNTAKKMFDLTIRYSSPSLMWLGNFGTRSNQLTKVTPSIILDMASMGDTRASYYVQKYGEASWSDDINLWEEVLNINSTLPVLKNVENFESIQGKILRNGNWHAWFGNYDKSLWAKGFLGLWSAQSDEMIFSVLHSLPSVVEKAKLQLGETNDWAGFPHIRIDKDSEMYDTQQGIEEISIDENENQIIWSELLKSDDGMINGILKSNYTFGDSILKMRLQLDRFSGKVYVDFHIQKRKNQLFHFWNQTQVDSIRAGRLPYTGAYSENFRDVEFDLDKNKEVAIQMDKAIYSFKFIKIPQGTRVITGFLKFNSLHTKNDGGVRLRLILPSNISCADFEIDFEQLNF